MINEPTVLVLGAGVTCVGLQLRGIPVKQYPRWPTEPMSPEDKGLLETGIHGMLDGLARAA